MKKSKAVYRQLVKYNALFNFALYDSIEKMLQTASTNAAQKQYRLLVMFEDQVQDRCGFLLHGGFQGCQEVCVCVIVR